MTVEEFATATKDKIEYRDMQVRQVTNGFIFVTNRRFHDPDTGTQSFSLGGEGVAADTASLTAAMGRFFETGDPSGEAQGQMLSQARI